MGNIFKKIEGKTIPMAMFILLGFSVLMMLVFMNSQPSIAPTSAEASTATTSVTVLNTPPQWTIDAQESTESSTNTPTNAGSDLSITGIGTDSNNDPYFLLVCKTSGAPTPFSNAPPECSGGSGNRWSRSATTTSATNATSTYVTQASDAELNDWFAFICDANASNPACNATYKVGTYPTESPFVVNHRPSFTVFTDNSPKDPGQTVTWTTTASDADVVVTADTVQLFVCKANDFTGTACGAGGTYCSTGASTTDPSCNFDITIPTQDGNYTAFGFVVDNHNFAASGGAEGSDSVLTVNNVTPTISSSTIALRDTDSVGDLTLLTMATQTPGFSVRFTITDDNSCLNASSGNEISQVDINVFRSGIASTSCLVSGDYNANNCYPEAAGIPVWNTSSSTQLTGTCSGASDPDAVWATSFPLYYIADPTDAGSQFPSQDWQATVRASDNNFATSTWTQTETGNEMTSFLAFDLLTVAINYGSLQPGDQNPFLVQNATTSATGNTGVSLNLSGDDMCTAYPSCSYNATDTIPSTEQHYASSTVAYASGTALSSTTPAFFDLAVPKSTATSTQANRATDWGIRVPPAITLAGAYTGKNTFVSVVSDSSDW
ncbi:MAG: hypothetical protein A3A28_00945 [Candidatus Sungbacteria bacterium RIFCSPLOWO2_01_FULL_47_32]|nr:MAG: hypothetical protein A3D57_01695 [Candidatus Sungbacteria bacterium RIFCSPHIGHO2_02_FULL_46_12]OHA05737.1 MAG: hypothetical protein A3A28_00945 [Candidatus Sungbacteria bacterium RIFCSPLOWO2_01_FULL_47_32]